MKRNPRRYVAYLPNSEQHTNAARSYAGIGFTKEEALENAQYWANQLP